ncbi:MAG: hypothetical protein NZ602_03425, partial [Thermoguttaceae bacterium]|nr:hypothetical protein [Thermoguttaceae bacterium]
DKKDAQKAILRPEADGAAKEAAKDPATEAIKETSIPEAPFPPAVPGQTPKETDAPGQAPKEKSPSAESPPSGKEPAAPRPETTPGQTPKEESPSWERPSSGKESPAARPESLPGQTLREKGFSSEPLPPVKRPKPPRADWLPEGYPLAEPVWLYVHQKASDLAKDFALFLTEPSEELRSALQSHGLVPAAR